MAGSKNHYWVSYADLMTLLMVVFLFISVTLLASLQKKQNTVEEALEDYQKTNIQIYNSLQVEFKDDLEKWNMEIDRDLSIKFSNPEVLFAIGQFELSQTFQLILADFIPRYLKVLLDPAYRGKIKEIRIEGHTDASPISVYGDPYIDNMELSQARARRVLSFIRGTGFYTTALSESDKAFLDFVLTANGMSYGRLLDKNKQLVYNSKKAPDDQTSRRVEFKVVTSSEELVKQITKELELSSNETR
jgi:outer membrane protein OmpA-like peptidoglycan-associated protein